MSNRTEEGLSWSSFDVDNLIRFFYFNISMKNFKRLTDWKCVKMCKSVQIMCWIIFFLIISVYIHDKVLDTIIFNSRNLCEKIRKKWFLQSSIWWLCVFNTPFQILTVHFLPNCCNGITKRLEILHYEAIAGYHDLALFNRPLNLLSLHINIISFKYQIIRVHQNSVIFIIKLYCKK